VAMSSFSHQNYTRKWMNCLNGKGLMFSIDYSLSPAFEYPYALDDCWQAYLWIVILIIS